MRIRNKFAKIVIRFFSYTVILLLLLFIALPPILNRVIPLEKIKPNLENGLSDFFQRKWVIDHLEFNLFPRPVISGIKVFVYDKNGSVLVSSPKISAFPDLWFLLKREIYVKNLNIYRPKFILRFRHNGKFNFGKISRDIWKHAAQAPPAESKSNISIVLRKFRLLRAEIILYDEDLPKKKLTPSITGHAYFDVPTTSAPVTVIAELDVKEKNRNGIINVFGKFGDTTDVQINSRNLPISAMADYFPYLNNVDGNIHLTAWFNSQNEIASWDLKGKTDPIHPRLAENIPLTTKGNFEMKSDFPLNASLNLDGPSTKGTIFFSWPDWNTPHYFLNGYFDSIKIEELTTFKNLIPSASTGTPQNFHVYNSSPSKSAEWILESSITANSVQYKTLTFSDFEGKIYGSSTNPWLAEGRIKGLGGTAETTATWKSGGTSTGTLHINWNINNIEFASLEKIIIGDYRTTGILMSQGYLTGDTPQFISPHLNGAFSFQLYNGNVGGLKGLIKFLSAFNMKTLFQDVKGKKTKGIPFALIQGNFNVVNGVLNTTIPAKIAGATVDIAAQGKVDLTTQKTEGDMVVQFLNPIDETISFIPGTKTILMNGKKTFLPILAHFKGDVGNPDIKIQTAKSVEKKVLNTILGVFKLPKSILDTVTGTINKIEPGGEKKK